MLNLEKLYIMNITYPQTTKVLNLSFMATYLNHFNLLQTIPLLYFLVTLTCNGSSLSHDDECLALYKFKQSINHQDDVDCAASWFQTFHTWKPTSDSGFDCCSWFGVECGNDHEYGHVIGLDLSESSLCGEINSTSTLFSLVHLQSLNLAMNNFHESEIPSEIASLKQLRSLDLSDSGFSGQIPNNISQLMQLSSLDFSGNTLKLRSPNGLKNLLQNFTQLEELDLSGVEISSSLPNFLGNFSSLRSITLEDCSLQNEFPGTILQLPNLKRLDVTLNTDLIGSILEFRNKSFLEHVDLSSTGFFGIVPESISNLKHLVFLDLSHCSFSGRIPRSVSNLTQLTFLSLGKNKFTSFFPSLVSLSELNILDLTGNRFEKGCLPNWLGKLTTLTELYISEMNIKGEISPFLANLTDLSALSMGKNFLIGHIPSWIFNLTQLGTLDLQQSQLQGLIPSSFTNLKTLQYLNLGWNNFSGKVDLDMFLGLNKLETFIIGDNRISVVGTTNYTNSTLPELKFIGLSTCNINEFPAFLHSQNRIEILFLDRNKIDDMIPVSIWNNSKETLQVIDLSQNSITGFDGNPQFLPWERLQEFDIYSNQAQGQLPIPPQTTVIYDVSHNHFMGEIPPLICEVKSLRVLDLSSNNMSGTLPLCFSNVINLLVTLDLSRNKLHGRMMDVFMHGSQLKSIDLSENQFSGKMPRSLTNCTNLEILSLGDNSFKEVFPYWLGTLPNLQVLVLRANKFYGPIQGSTSICSQFPKLGIIDLSNNRFSGLLHHNYFQACNAIKIVYDSESSVMVTTNIFGSITTFSPYHMTLIHKGVRTEYNKILTIDIAIDLSCNHFEGEIPLSLQDLRGLQSLNLSNNNFTGHVFPSLGYLKNLESLDLSRNKLSGGIPQELVQLNFLSIFNVSFNNLDGRIPHGKQFDTFENSSYMGNSRLCGKPLSNECRDSMVPRLPPASNPSDESLLPSEKIDWIVIFCGVGSGLVVGVVIGNFLFTRYSDMFTKMKDR